MTSSLICLIGLRHRFSRLEAETKSNSPLLSYYTSLLCQATHLEEVE